MVVPREIRRVELVAPGGGDVGHDGEVKFVWYFWSHGQVNVLLFGNYLAWMYLF